MDGDQAKAESYWIPAELELSRRLGILYTDVEAKYDCASPVMNNLQGVREGSIIIKPGIATIHGDWAELPVSIIAAKDSAQTVYYFSRYEDEWCLTAPLFIHTRDWSTVETRYATVHFNDNRLLNSYALDEVDRFVDTLGLLMSIPESDLKRLAEARIHYYLCNEQEMEQLTGFPAHGMTNLQFDAIVTRHLPHYHEMVHFMMNYSLKTLPLYTLPCLQEGTACYLGGRWGKSPDVILYSGFHIINMDIADWESILTWDGFHRQVGMPDITYPLSAVLVELLIEKSGFKAFSSLYMKHSGTSDYVIAFDWQQIKSSLSSHIESDWLAFGEQYLETAEKYKYCGIRPGISGIKKKEILELNSQEIDVKILEFEDSYGFEVGPLDGNGGCVITLKDSELEVEPDYKSWMFTEQVQEGDYNGEVFGLHVLTGDVGLYDYIYNVLIAKYICGFLPSDEYINPENTIKFSLDKDLLPKHITEYQIEIICH